jgi:hypothetical protein
MPNPVKRPGLTENLSGGELFIYDDQGSELSVLNATALFIWSLCDGENSAEQIGAVMADIYPEAPLDRLRDDIAITLQAFHDKRLLQE